MESARQALINAIALSKSIGLGKLAALEAVKRAAKRNAALASANRIRMVEDVQLGMEKPAKTRSTGVRRSNEKRDRERNFATSRTA